MELARSFKLGVIRLTERFVKSDPLVSRDERRLTRYVAGEIERHCSQIVALHCLTDAFEVGGEVR